jgi:hypothetical protein
MPTFRTKRRGTNGEAGLIKPRCQLTSSKFTLCCARFSEEKERQILNRGVVPVVRDDALKP